MAAVDDWGPEWSPELRCGGISIGGAEPRWCEIHMRPWGHRRPGGMDHREEPADSGP